MHYILPYINYNQLALRPALGSTNFNLFKNSLLDLTEGFFKLEILTRIDLVRIIVIRIQTEQRYLYTPYHKAIAILILITLHRRLLKEYFY